MVTELAGWSTISVTKASSYSAFGVMVVGVSRLPRGVASGRSTPRRPTPTSTEREPETIGVRWAVEPAFDDAWRFSEQRGVWADHHRRSRLARRCRSPRRRCSSSPSRRGRNRVVDNCRVGREAFHGGDALATRFLRLVGLTGHDDPTIAGHKDEVRLPTPTVLDYELPGPGHAASRAVVLRRNGIDRSEHRGGMPAQVSCPADWSSRS